MESKIDIIDLLMKIKTRPGMYLGTKSLTLLKAYLDGFWHAEALLCGKTDSVLDEFPAWIYDKYDIHDTHGWSQIIGFWSTDDAAAFDLFNKHLDQFLAQKKNSEGEPDHANP